MQARPAPIVVRQVIAILIPLALTIIGLALEKTWARWSALAGAVGVLPWAAFLTFGLPVGRS